MVGFSEAINKLGGGTKWSEIPEIRVKKQKTKKPQTGAGKIAKKRHVAVDIKKSKKPSKKQKVRP